LYCKRQGIEWVAEQLLASQGELFCVALTVIHCNDLTVTVLRMYKAAAVLTAMMKMYAFPFHYRGYINVMLVLQSCSDSLHILPGSSTETDGVCNFSNIEVEDNDVDVIEEDFKAIHEEVNVGVKQEDIPGDITFPDVKSEPNEVSYVLYLLLDTFYQCPGISVFMCVYVYVYVISGQLKQLHCWE
jgi:hypothetical protein